MIYLLTRKTHAGSVSTVGHVFVSLNCPSACLRAEFGVAAAWFDLCIVSPAQPTRPVGLLQDWNQETIWKLSPFIGWLPHLSIYIYISPYIFLDSETNRNMSQQSQKLNHPFQKKDPGQNIIWPNFKKPAVFPVLVFNMMLRQQKLTPSAASFEIHCDPQWLVPYILRSILLLDTRVSKSIRKNSQAQLHGSSIFPLNMFITY